MSRLIALCNISYLLLLAKEHKIKNNQVKTIKTVSTASLNLKSAGSYKEKCYIRLLCVVFYFVFLDVNRPVTGGSYRGVCMLDDDFSPASKVPIVA